MCLVFHDTAIKGKLEGFKLKQVNLTTPIFLGGIKMDTKWYTYSTPPYLDLPSEDEDDENEKKEYDEDVFKEDR